LLPCRRTRPGGPRRFSGKRDGPPGRDQPCQQRLRNRPAPGGDFPDLQRPRGAPGPRRGPDGRRA
jgi:hypothetical protein